MKRLMPLVILSVSCLLASSRHSHARLGETEQEITKRYGTVNIQVRDLPRGVDKMLLSRKNGIDVAVFIAGGKSVAERYTIRSVDKDVDTESAEVMPSEEALKTFRSLIDTNSQGSRWRDLPEAKEQTNGTLLYAWERVDGKAVATIIASEPDTVLVKDQVFQNAANTGAAGF